ncbi:MAG: MBL fold metallo-hydrolase [Candidatus Uhrbacteria bacterium]|nr:MBL fold metallo-hydrolase [Candidatus Uhrbacteria bacterium]
MQIFWHGLSCVRIEASYGDTEATLVTDPYGSDTGLRFPRTLKPDVVALTHQDREMFAMDAFSAEGGSASGGENEPFVIDNPGEYEVSGIFDYAIPVRTADESRPHHMMHRFEVEGMSIGFLGNLKRPLTDEEIAKLGNIDILLLPVGGGDHITAKQAVEIIKLVEPRVVVPLAYHVEGLKKELGTADAFCKELVCKRQDANKLKITKKDLPSDDLVVTVLERA